MATAVGDDAGLVADDDVADGEGVVVVAGVGCGLLECAVAAGVQVGLT
ncbi:hypothetical protein ACFXPS_25030 [Nocardia sp. NPDC059091]